MVTDLDSARRWALIVATSAYTDPSLTQLRSPAHDADAMAEVLADPQIGAFTIATVTDRPSQTVREEIDSFLADRAREDTVVLYISCHGIQDRRGNLYFATVNTNRSRIASTGIDAAWIHDRLEECKARRQVVILDCCFSGSFGPHKGMEIDVGSRLSASGRGRVILTASRAAEYSFEGAALTDFAGHRSIFTAALVEGLRTGAADRGRTGLITVHDAFEYAAKKVAATGLQNPQRTEFHSEGVIVLGRSPFERTDDSGSDLPPEVAALLYSPQPADRRTAVTTLAGWLGADDAARAYLAETMLRRTADEDIPSVGNLARKLLETPEPPSVAAPRRPRRSYRLLYAASGHRGQYEPMPLNSVAFSPDGRLIATGGCDDKARTWIAETGKPAGKALGGHSGWVLAAQFSPDGQYVATGGVDDRIRFWTTTPSGRLLRPASVARTGSVGSLAFSPDGLTLATGGGYSLIQLWNPLPGRGSGPGPSPSGPVQAVAFQPGGNLLATTGRADRVRLWNAQTGTVAARPLIDPEAAVPDNAVQLWHPASGRRAAPPCVGHVGPVGAVAFSPDGAVLASAGADTTVRLWNPADGSPLDPILTGHTGWVLGLAFSPDGAVLATAGADGLVRLWDVASGEPAGDPLTGNSGPVTAVAFAPDGGMLATAGADTTLRVWQRET